MQAKMVHFWIVKNSSKVLKPFKKTIQMDMVATF